MSILKRAVLGVAAAAAISGVHAQQTPTAPDPATMVIADPTCEQPPKRPPLGATAKEQERFNKSTKVYLDCMVAYAKAQEATAKQYQAVAQKFIDSGNKAINTYNDYINEVKKNSEADD